MRRFGKPCIVSHEISARPHILQPCNYKMVLSCKVKKPIELLHLQELILYTFMKICLHVNLIQQNINKLSYISRKYPRAPVLSTAKIEPRSQQKKAFQFAACNDWRIIFQGYDCSWEHRSRNPFANNTLDGIFGYNFRI